MKIVILTAILGNFDTPVDPVKQDIDVTFHRFTDENFPPITGLTPRFQYRISKLFGWQMFPGYDIYIWLDGCVSFKRSDCVKWYLEQLGDNDVAFFKHPVRRNIRQEVEHIEQKLKEKSPYITPRYKNGLHREMLNLIQADKNYNDKHLYTSTAFIYKNNNNSRRLMTSWWYFQSRFFTCDQVSQPYAAWMSLAKVKVINENQYKIGYLSLTGRHK